MQTIRRQNAAVSFWRGLLRSLLRIKSNGIAGYLAGEEQAQRFYIYKDVYSQNASLLSGVMFFYIQRIDLKNRTGNTAFWSKPLDKR